MFIRAEHSSIHLNQINEETARYLAELGYPNKNIPGRYSKHLAIGQLMRVESYQPLRAPSSIL